MRQAWIWSVVWLIAAACSGDGPTDPADSEAADSEPVITGDVVAGGIAFHESCAECHASGDGFDLAYFGFPGSDIVRRAVAHVDSATARNIAAYIHSLGVSAGSGAPPFQPLAQTDLTDVSFWQKMFGTEGWPASLTPDALRAVNLRAVAIPLKLLPWSSEPDESDWMPERALPDSLLSAEGGVLRAALDTYLSVRSTEALVTAVDVFQGLTRTDDPAGDRLCAGTGGIHAHPEGCFEARRWMSSLAAIHFLRGGDSDHVPFPVARLWWDTGDAAVTMYFRLHTVGAAAVAGWLYLASTYAPDGFPGPYLAEDSGYMGQFLLDSNLKRLALFVSLRRMVDRGPIHTGNALQSFWDLYLAATRSPDALRGDAILFGLRYLDQETRAGRIPEGGYADDAAWMLDALLTLIAQAGHLVDPKVRAEVEALVPAIKARVAGG